MTDPKTPHAIEIPRSITIDLDKNPALASMLVALHVAHTEQHALLTEAYEAQQARLKKYATMTPEEAARASAEDFAATGICTVPMAPPSPKLTLGELAGRFLAIGMREPRHAHPHAHPTDIEAYTGMSPNMPAPLPRVLPYIPLR